jgi:hypothetical protein
MTVYARLSLCYKVDLIVLSCSRLCFHSAFCVSIDHRVAQAAGSSERRGHSGQISVSVQSSHYLERNITVKSQKAIFFFGYEYPSRFSIVVTDSAVFLQRPVTLDLVIFIPTTVGSEQSSLSGLFGNRPGTSSSSDPTRNHLGVSQDVFHVMRIVGPTAQRKKGINK